MDSSFLALRLLLSQGANRTGCQKENSLMNASGPKGSSSPAVGFGFTVYQPQTQIQPCTKSLQTSPAAVSPKNIHGESGGVSWMKPGSQDAWVCSQPDSRQFTLQHTFSVGEMMLMILL